VFAISTAIDRPTESLTTSPKNKSESMPHFFNYCELSDKKQILVRSVLVPDSINPAKTGGGRRVTEAELMAMAQDRKTVDLVKIGRQMRNVWNERPESTAGGSVRYWTNPQMLPVTASM
jgi:hypothetical protein